MILVVSTGAGQGTSKAVVAEEDFLEEVGLDESSKLKAKPAQEGGEYFRWAECL